MSDRTPFNRGRSKPLFEAAVNECREGVGSVGFEWFLNPDNIPVALIFESTGEDYLFYWRGGTVLVNGPAFRAAEKMAIAQRIPVVLL